jgi:ADP-heptose:LPS heptosyltransferase
VNVLVDKCSVLGDCLCYLPALKALADAPGVERIVVVTTPIGEPVFANLFPQVEIISVPWRQTLHAGALVGYLRVLPQLAFRRFGAAVHNHHSQTFAYGLAWALRIPVRIGFEFGMARGNRLASVRLPLDRTRNVLDLNLEPIRYLTRQPDLRPARVAPWVGEADSASVRRVLAGAGVDRPYVVVHRGARHAYRRWPYFEELARRIGTELKLAVVEAPEADVPACSDIVRLPSLPFRAFAALVAGAKAFVGNNSGPMHLAGALGVPTVVLQGASAENWSFAWPGVPHRSLRVGNLPCVPCEKLEYYPPTCENLERPLACMRDLSAQTALTALQEVLAEAGKQKGL